MSRSTSPLVLIPHRIVGNIYVRELGRAYQGLGAQVVYGPENLFESDLSPDIVHLQWPEDQYRGYSDGPVDRRVDVFLDRLDRSRQGGARLAWTLHNLNPHEYRKSDPDERAYRGVIERADLIVHHCDCSQKLLAERYELPGSTAEIVHPHGHYLSYANTATRESSRDRLGIPRDAVVYLHFGAIRGYKGLDSVLTAFDQADVPGKFLIIAGQYKRDSGWQGRLDNLKLTGIERLSRNKLAVLNSVPKKDVQYFLNASDALVLGHKRGLNSGVAVLGMTFGRLVIGPDIGCIGPVLASGRNLVYPAGNVNALTRAMEAVPGLDLEPIADTNRRVAASWRWEDTARGVLEHFRQSAPDASPRAARPERTAGESG